MTARERDPVDALTLAENVRHALLDADPTDYKTMRAAAGDVDALAARVQELERIEAQARRVEKVYEGLRTDASDGTFALWTEDDLVRELHRLGDVLRESA